MCSIGAAAWVTGTLPQELSKRVARTYHALRSSPHASSPKRPKGALFDYNQVDDFVLLGRQPRGVHDLEELVAQGVTAVLSMCHEDELFVRSNDPVWSDLGLSRLQVPVPDFSAPSDEQLTRALSFVSKRAWKHSQSSVSKPERIYVHCNAGKGRSALVVLLYLRQKRPTTNPSWLFRELQYARPVISSAPLRYPITASSRILFSNAGEWTKTGEHLRQRELK